MSKSQNPSPMSRLRDLRRGLGEILGFAGAALRAVFEILTGRWPEVKERRRRKRAPLQPPEGSVDRIAPYPVQEG